MRVVGIKGEKQGAKFENSFMSWLRSWNPFKVDACFHGSSLLHSKNWKNKIQSYLKIHILALFCFQHETWSIWMPCLNACMMCHVKNKTKIDRWMFNGTLGNTYLDLVWTLFSFAISSFLAWFLLKCLPKHFECVKFESSNWICNCNYGLIH